MSGTISNPWARSFDDVAHEVLADRETGLRASEAARRLAASGPNEIDERPPESSAHRLLRQFRDPLVLLLLVAIAISIVAWVLDGADGFPLETVVIAAIVILNAVIGFWQEAKAIGAVVALRALSATHSSVVRDGHIQRVLTADLVVGDTLLLAEGDAVGADARLFLVQTMYTLEGSLTGESAPVEKSDDVLDALTPLAERTNIVYRGTAIARGRGGAIVVGTGMGTEIGRIAGLLDQAESPTPLQREIAWLGRRLGTAVVIVATIVVAAIVITSDDRSLAAIIDAALVGVSLAVAAVPEGLPAILSVVLALGVQRMAGEHAIVKRLSSVETLGAASVICTDKTGTLTRNEMTIVRVVTSDGEVELTGVGYVPIGDVLADGVPVTDPDRLRSVEFALAAGSMANDASLRPGPNGSWEVHGDPTEVAFLVAEEKLGTAQSRRDRFERVAELPFTSERRRMSTVQRDQAAEGGAPEFVLVSKGAPDVMLDRCNRELRSGRPIELTDERRAAIVAEVDRLAGDALRTISVTYRAMPSHVDGDPVPEHAEHDLVHIGVVGILDPPRPEVAQAIADAHAAGIRVIMITGDHPATAAQVGAILGIGGTADVGVIGTAAGTTVADLLPTTSVFARVEPEHKLALIEELQRSGNIVAMTGDGVNDAPALRRADIGVAMGTTGTEVAKEAADMILADDNFTTILHAVREGREIFNDIRKVLRYLLASNAGEVMVMLLGVLLAGWLGLNGAGGEAAVPLLATQILWINLVTDGASALALGVDPAVENVMQRPPRAVDERVIDPPMLLTIGLLGVTATVAALVALDLRLPGGPLGGDGDIVTARTMVFTTLVLAQVCNAFNARSDRVSAFVRPFENRLLWASVGITVLLQLAVVHVRPMQEAFDTNALDVTEWLMCAGLASSVLWVDEARKWVVRRRRPSPIAAALGT